MQSVLNLSLPLKHNLLIGAPCAGKDVFANQSIKSIKQQRPNLKVYVIDIKAYSSKSQYSSCADILWIQDSSAVVTDSDVEKFVAWIRHCFTEFESLEGEKLLVLPESTLIFHFFGQNRNNRTWLANKIINYLCLGNAAGIYIWLLGSSFFASETGISRQFWVSFNPVLIVHKDNLALYNYLLGTDFLPKDCRLSAERIRAIASQSPVGRAVYHDGQWLPMPELALAQ
ncbi:hypothetical protein H6G80_31350 [Nostoc sp. FACHB-87]|uniref:hypothetical protein n=1 Tax=Nostocales TaxID=1161 RepID=UPI0016863304|nr:MULTISPECIES: hypothetical protein [Nostocales]MBD2302603.1 hypothetical protein [Nostoc sp. FACHB-190]MBD2458549.1 hypothetical protein [Nostoc sp. FACHB-87]MBD2479629.1 hypothetical protein [Anabaena sp. FACHB-83]MBD2492711.1 hypothetical protein [Aulosira sp. FACHB-615]